MCCEADAEVDFCKWTEELWRIYLSLDENSLEQVLEYVDEDCSVIGTEAHEFTGVCGNFWRILPRRCGNAGMSRFSGGISGVNRNAVAGHLSGIWKDPYFLGEPGARDDH